MREILHDIEEADALAHAHSREMTGTVRLLALPSLATHLVAPAMAGFQRQYPKLQIDIHADDAAHPNLQEYDLALLTDSIQLNANTVVRTIRETSSIFCASPEYLRRHGEPSTPQELAQPPLLRRRPPGQRLAPIVLVDPTGREPPVTVDAAPSFVTNNLDTALRATVEGAGISSQSMQMIAPMLKSGQLRRVLRPWITDRFTVVAALPSRKFMPARTRAVLDYLIDYARRIAAGVDEEAPLQ